MDLKSQKVNTFFILILFASNLSLVAPTNTWVGSKYQIQCTMCAACDNPCNQPPPPPAAPIFPPPPPPTSSGGGSYSPPPPTSSGGGSYYSPPQGQGVYYYYPPPAPYNYPNPGPPNPITNYYPYYYHSPPLRNSAAVSVPGATAMLLIFICFFSL